MIYSTTYLWKETRLPKLHISLVAFLLLISYCSGEGYGSWYRGCFIHRNGSIESYTETEANLADCSKECINKGFYFIAVQGGTCRCLVRVDNLERVASDVCDFRCAGIEEKNLPCGEEKLPYGERKHNAWSVYTASGPFIKKVEPQEVLQWIEPNIPTTLEAVAMLNEFVDVTEEPLIESEWKNTVEFVWQSEFIVVGVNITANSSQERAMCTLTFPNTGNFPIELKVRNLLTSVHTYFTIAVVVPKPRDIQLLPIIDQWSLPSCIPPTKLLGNTSEDKLNYGQFAYPWNLKKAQIDSGVEPVVAVFSNTSFGLEVSVATGSDLLFDISIWNGSSWEVFQHAPHQGKAGCNTPLDCRSVVQAYMFRTTGVFPVSATVRNMYGSVEANLTVVVMDQRIRDVTAELVTPNSNIVRTKEVLIFHLTAVTADRQSTFIQVDFADGVVKTAAVREKQNMSLTDSYTPTLFASYGNGCKLILQFDHDYLTEGVFIPQVTLFNNISSVTVNLEQPITVLNEISEVVIKCDDFVPVDQSFEVFVEYTSMSVNATVMWTIFDDSDSVFVNRTTTTLSTSFNFRRVGRYKIVCTVSNLINSKTSAAHVVVQVPVGKVNLSCNLGPYIEIEQEIVCTATAQSGSDLSFAWDFQEYTKSIDVSTGNLTSIAKHTFFYPGIYNISVDVQNDVNNAVGQLSYNMNVEIPIDCLNVITTIPSSPGEAVNIMATSTRGTNLKFYLDVGHEVMIAPHDVYVNGDTTIFSVNWVFHGPARHHVTAFAYNHISNASRSVEVHVQEPPPEFSIHLLPTPLPNFRKVVLKNNKGLFLHRYDLLFQFHFPDGVIRTTQVPVVIWAGKDSLQKSQPDDSLYQNEEADEDVIGEGRDSHFHVNVTVTNKVGQKSKVLSLANNESSVESDQEAKRNKNRRKRRKQPVLWHPTFVRADEFTSFLLANKSREITDLHIDYGDGLKGTVSCSSDSCSWDRKFQVPGVFALDVSLNGRRPSRKDQTLRSVLVVEEPIKGLQLLGPTDVGIGCDQEWTANLDTGSHVVYVWSLDGAARQPTTINKYIVGFSVPGTHTLHLNVSNDVSATTTEASLTFTVKHPIVDVSVTVLPKVVGIATNITILIQGGREFTISCNFGDGQYMTFYSGDLALMKLVPPPLSDSTGRGIPIYEVGLKHDYKSTGEYNVSVTVSNGISSIHRVAWAVVEEAIGSVQLYTETTELLPILHDIVVTAVVSSGRNLTFDWDFSDASSTTVNSEGNTSTAIHTYSIPELYEISVTVSNHLQNGVRVTLPFLVNVVEPISKATITHVGPKHFRPNAAELLATSDGLFSTQEVQFEARADGSSVQFTFDFGDGQSTIVDGSENQFFQMMLASVKHVYSQVGAYVVKLTASNALGNLTVQLQDDLFYVQIPPERLEINASELCIQFGKMTYFEARVQSGTNVSYTWKLDDETELVDAGTYVPHRYRRCGAEHIQVTASNKVDSISTYRSVKIVEKILGVNVSVNSVVIAGEPVHHMAIIHPPSAQLDLLYVWKFRFKESDSLKQHSNKSIEYAYTQSGRPLVQVEAVNCLGSVKSAAVEIHVVAMLRELSIKVLGSAIVSSPLNLMANYWQGDSLTFTWNFGDGSENVTIKGSHISHNYSQIGEYIVKLHAKNPVSQADVSKRIFVLNTPCDPPEIIGLGLSGPGNQSELEFLHSEPIRVEAEIRTNCTTLNQVMFTWKVMDSISRLTIDVSPLEHYLQCPALLLPAKKLPIGRYLVKLTVAMNETEIPVYSESEVNISILATPLVSIIYGGIYRQVGQQGHVHLDGRGSGSPDNSTVSIGYRWTCSPLRQPGSNCFESPDEVPAMDESQLSFPANWLSSNFSEFDFNLTVFRLNDLSTTDETPTNTADSSQVISVQKDHQTIDLLIECPQCWRNMVNPGRKVSLRAHCPRCVGGPLIYQWELEILGPEDSSQNSYTDHSVCSYTAGSPFHMKVGSSTTSTTLAINSSSSLDLVFTEGGQVIKSQILPEMITDSEHWEKQENRATERRERISGDVSEEKSRSPSDSLPDPAEEMYQSSRRLRFPMSGLLPEEVVSGGTSVARNKDGVIGEPVEVPGGKRTFPIAAVDPVVELATLPPCTPYPDCLKQIAPLSPLPPHIISKDRHVVRLSSDQTLTGLDQQSLVIRPGVLKQGQTYFVQVRAKALDGSNGLTMAFFEVNRSPDKGKCTVQPQSGTSLKTIFRFFCREWRDEHLPLRYEVSYSLDGSESDGDRQVIYHGLRHTINFQLPAGLSTNKYQVLVHVAIIDRLGARTLICRSPVEVRPTHGLAKDREAAGTEQLLWNETLALHQLASNSVYDGFNHDLFGPLTQLAYNLNAHRSLGQLGAHRTDIRQTILDTLTYIPLRDEVEIIQALRCMVETTDQPNELNRRTIIQTRKLLQDINEQVNSLFDEGIGSGWSRGLNSQILSLAARVVSNLLTALTSNPSLFHKNVQHENLYRKTTSDILQVLNSFIQLELQYHSLGEKSLLLQNRFISLNASHYSLYNLSPLAMNGVHFQLPPSLRSLLTSRYKENTTLMRENAARSTPKVYGYENNWQCFQTRALSFLSNPFAFLTRETDMVQSELASLDIYNCFGDKQLEIRGLPHEDMIKIIIPKKVNQVTNATFKTYYLDKAAMNVHQLNASIPHQYENVDNFVERSDKYIHIHIQLEPVLEGRKFPIMVIISSHEAPNNLKEYVFKQVYNTDDIKIFLPPGSIDGGMHYYICLVEASFNSGRRHSNEVKGRHYTLNTWWGACVYWNDTKNTWHSNGCEVLQISSADAMHCLCNHLTTFGGYFELIPHDLSSIDVDAFFSLHENPVAIVLVVVSLLLYIVLVMVLRQADIHDSKKGNCVYLQDNAVTHRQKYEVLMETGCSTDAGTTSKVSIILHGEEGVSETRELISDDNYPMFERESRDRFVVTLPDSLGKIFKIQLWHNNSGSSPGWFLQHVVVRDLNTGQAFYFLCQKWLAVDKEDGKVEREFAAIDGKNISFGQIFWFKGNQYFGDFHTWLSVWKCPPHSRFTRVQRLTVCFTLLMTYMCLSAMWFKQRQSEIRGEFGLLDLSWHNITVGCICCAIVLPMNLILSFLFRRSRVHYPGYEQDKTLLGGKSGCELASEYEDEPAQPTVTYSILDQSILNWQNIQDWAQKQWLKRQQSVRSSANSVKTTQASPQLSAPSTTPLVQTLWAEEDTDQASSGFEDATSQVTTERQRVKPASEISFNWKKSKEVDQSEVVIASRRIFLPFWCRYVGWTLCLLISCTCGTITILYGFRFGHTRSVMWIQSIYFSFMMCLFIAQPFLILICVVYTAVCHRNNPAVFDHYNDGFYGERVSLARLHKQRSHYHEDEEELQRGVAERSRSRYLRFAGPPQEKQLKSSRKKLIKQKRAMLLLSDTIWFAVMFALLCIMAFGKDLQKPYHLNKALKHSFIEKRINGTSFSQLKSSTDWYKWSQSVLLDILYKQTSLRDEAYHTSESLGFVLGHVQLRQLKIRPEPCYAMPFVELNPNCFHGHGSESNDSSDTVKSTLIDQNRDKTINPGIWGKTAWYGSSGYVLQLNNTREAATEQLKMLETSQWINMQTWVVFVELTLFNAASNLFSSVTLLLEMTSAGQVFTSYHIMSTYLFRYISVWDNCILACELLYIVLTLSMFYHQLHQMVTVGYPYFSHFWNYIELLMAVLSLMYTGCYVYRFVLVSEAVELMRSTFYDEFINLAFLTWWDELLKALTGAILFCVVLKLLCVLRYHQMFWRLQIVFRRCKRELLIAACLYGGFIMAFSSLNAGLFGCVVYSMRSLWSSILTMSALSVRGFNWPNDRNTVSHQSPWIDIVLLFSFTFCHGFVLTYIFTVLSYRLKRTKNCRVLSMTGHQLVSLYWDKVLKWAGWRSEASYEQIDSTLPPEFTMAEILYLVEEMLFRMNALLGMSGLPDKRHSFTDSDATANLGDDGISSGSSEDRPVPVTTAIAAENTRLEQCVQKIEDKLCSHEPYLAQLLKLDSIGTNILSEEKEQELRSHLEFEIFRQLQVQRQESTTFDAPNHSHAACSNVEAMSFNMQTSPGLGYFSDEIMGTKDGASVRSQLHPSTHKCKGDGQPASKISPESTLTSQEAPQCLRSAQEAQAAPLKPILLLPPKRSQSMKVPGRQAGRHHLTEALRTQKQWLDLSTTNEMAREARMRAKLLNTASSIPKYHKVCGKKDYQSVPTTYDKKIRTDMLKQDVPVAKRSLLNKDLFPDNFIKLRDPKSCKQDPGVGFLAAAQNASSGNISPHSSESEKGHKRTDSSSGQSGLERNDITRTSIKRPELPPKPTFSHVILPPLESGKSLAGWSPKPRQFAFLPEIINAVGAESSSGSEQEVTSKRVAQGRRNLRKTKSRGKGKGNEDGITSPMVLAADFASSGQSGGSDFDIIIHPIPSGIDPHDHTMPEEYVN